MNVVTPIRPGDLHQRRVRLARKPAAVAEARGQVRAALCCWRAPVDPDIAVLLASDLVTMVVRYGEGATVTLAIRCSHRGLRVDVYDASRARPPAMDAPADTEAGRWMALVAALADEWGAFRTPAGRALYFTLAFRTGLPRGNCSGPRGIARGDGGL